MKPEPVRAKKGRTGQQTGQKDRTGRQTGQTRQGDGGQDRVIPVWRKEIRDIFHCNIATLQSLKKRRETN